MWRSLGISHQDWRQTPSAVKTPLVSLAHQAHTLKIRCLAYQKQIAPLRQAAAQLQDLKAQIARHEEEIAALRRQMIRVADLQAEIAELKERLGQNSRNSHLPPSTDPPSQMKKKPEGQPTGRKRGAQPGHP